MSARLIAEIGADTSGFEAGLRRADAAAGSFGKKIAGKLNGAFGAGFLTGALIQAPQKLIDHAERIAEGASKLKLTTDEYQMLSAAAKDYNMEAAEFIKFHEDQGTALKRLIPLMEQYRSKIEMTAGEIKGLQELGSALREGGKGPAGLFSWLLRGTIGLGVGLGSGAAGIISTLSKPFGVTVGGINPEDWFHAAGKNLGIFDQDEESGAPLQIPLANRLKRRQRKFANLESSLAMLQLQEKTIRSDAAQRASIWNPNMTDWQQGGAFVRRGGIVIDETKNETNNKLEQIREETARVKDEIAKLRQATP